MIAVSSSAVTVTSKSATSALPTALANGTLYYIEIAAGVFLDLTAQPFAGIAGSTTWGFATTVATASGAMPRVFLRAGVVLLPAP